MATKNAKSNATIEQRLDQDGALRIMASRTLINEPGKYHVRVTNDVKALAEKGSVTKALAGGAVQVSIANLAAVTPYHVQAFKALFQEGEFDEAVNHNLTVSVRNTDYMPQKGETICINVGYVTTKTGEEALMVTSYTQVPVSAGRKMTIESLTDFAKAEERAEMTVGADFDV